MTLPNRIHAQPATFDDKGTTVKGINVHWTAHAEYYWGFGWFTEKSFRVSGRFRIARVSTYGGAEHTDTLYDDTQYRSGTLDGHGALHIQWTGFASGTYEIYFAGDKTRGYWEDGFTRDNIAGYYSTFEILPNRLRVTIP